jgi:hypothetical protein
MHTCGRVLYQELTQNLDQESKTPRTQKSPEEGGTVHKHARDKAEISQRGRENAGENAENTRPETFARRTRRVRGRPRELRPHFTHAARRGQMAPPRKQKRRLLRCPPPPAAASCRVMSFGEGGSCLGTRPAAAHRIACWVDSHTAAKICRWNGAGRSSAAPPACRPAHRAAASPLPRVGGPAAAVGR